MIRFITPPKQQVKEPTLLDNIKKFSKNFAQLIQKFDLIPNFNLIDVIQLYQEQNPWKIVTIWQYEYSQHQIWCQYGYEYSTKTLEMSCTLSKNSRIAKTNGTYYINLATGLFQKYSKQISGNKQNFQFNINPLTGTTKIASKVLIKQQQLRLQISRQDHLQSTLHQLSTMLCHCKQLIKIQSYLHGQTKICPIISFSKFVHKKENKNYITPEILMYSINQTLNEIDPNCQQNLDNFGDFDSIADFILKNEIVLPDQMLKIIEMLKGKQKIIKKTTEVPTIINNICDASDDDDTDADSQILVNKITFLTNPKNIYWQKFAMGGFGLIQKAFCRYQICDLNNKNRIVTQGELVRKSDTKTTKIEHEKKIFNLLKNDQHPIIMPQYISDEYPDYLFSKYEPNMSLDKYIKINRNVVSLLTISKLMQHTVKGLLFLKQKGISHLDIKPNNIIVTKDLKAKICDFGQAFYNKQDLAQRLSPAFTVPYAPVQLSYTQPYLNSKVDVYSFGVTLYKTLFNNHIWGQILNRNQFYERVCIQQPQISMAPEKLLRFGIPQIIGVLVNISLKCIQRQQIQRPSLFYLSILLSLCRYYLMSLIQGGFYINE